MAAPVFPSGGKPGKDGCFRYFTEDQLRALLPEVTAKLKPEVLGQCGAWQFAVIFKMLTPQQRKKCHQEVLVLCRKEKEILKTEKNKISLAQYSDLLEKVNRQHLMNKLPHSDIKSMGSAFLLPYLWSGAYLNMEGLPGFDANQIEAIHAEVIKRWRAHDYNMLSFNQIFGLKADQIVSIPSQEFSQIDGSKMPAIHKNVFHSPDAVKHIFSSATERQCGAFTNEQIENIDFTKMDAKIFSIIYKKGGVDFIKK